MFLCWLLCRSLLVENGGPGLHAYVAIHAGIKEMYVPYDYKLEEVRLSAQHAGARSRLSSASAVPSSGAEASAGRGQATGVDLHAVHDAINAKHCRCRSGSAAKIGGYKAFGTATGPAGPTTEPHPPLPTATASWTCVAPTLRSLPPLSLLLPNPLILLLCLGLVCSLAVNPCAIELNRAADAQATCTRY